MHLYKTVFLSLFALITFSTSLFFFQVRVKPSDFLKYQALIEETKELNSKKALEKESAKQFREKVQKDIYVLKDGKRLHFVIQCDRSHLTIQQKKEKIEAVENLEMISCKVQEEINFKTLSQQVRFLKADQGTYFFPSHQFIADSVDLLFYQLPGTDLPLTILHEKPYISAVAKKVTFEAMSKDPTFTAYHLQAKLDGFQLK